MVLSRHIVEMELQLLVTDYWILTKVIVLLFSAVGEADTNEAAATRTVASVENSIVESIGDFFGNKS